MKCIYILNIPSSVIAIIVTSVIGELFIGLARDIIINWLKRYLMVLVQHIQSVFSSKQIGHYSPHEYCVKQ